MIEFAPRNRTILRTSCSGVLTVLLILLTSAHSGLVLSAIFACQIDGTVIYQDWPCPVKQKKTNSQNNVVNMPFGIDASWFDLPSQARERAFCDKGGCECGDIETRHSGTLQQAVADALYLDGSWHRYDDSYTQWIAAAHNSAESFQLEEQMLEASCEVMISQSLLRSFGDDVMDSLLRRAATAEERGFDVEQPCLSGIEEACSFYDSVMLLARIRADARHLKMDRNASMAPASDLATALD